MTASRGRRRAKSRATSCPTTGDGSPARFRVKGVRARGDTIYAAPTVILTTGTFLKAIMHMGEAKTQGGRAGGEFGWNGHGAEVTRGGGGSRVGTAGIGNGESGLGGERG